MQLRREWPRLDDDFAYYESLPLYPDGVDKYGRERDAITARRRHQVIDVPDSNHQIILVSKPGAQAVAQAVDTFNRSRLRAD